MGFHRLPRICNYWNTDEYLGLPAFQKHMPLTRFWDLWCNMHLVDNEEADHSDQLYKVRPLIKCLTGTFAKHYNPSQEIAVDEAMIKCRDQAKGKVFMPNKPVKRGFKAGVVPVHVVAIYAISRYILESQPHRRTTQMLELYQRWSVTFCLTCTRMKTTLYTWITTSPVDHL